MGTALAEREADRIRRRDRYCAALRFAARRAVGEHERYWRRGVCRWRTARSDGCDAGPWADMDQEASDELMRRQRHGLVPAGPLDPIILPFEGDAGLVG